MRADDTARELHRARERLAQVLERARRLGPVRAGASPRRTVLRDDNVRLYHYPGDGTAAEARPLLVVYSLINRPDILDLRPERSLLAGFRDRGRPVYLVDWGTPDPADRFLGLEDYVCDYLQRCVDTVSSRHDGARVDLLGVCQGGVLALCYAALAPERVGKLVTLVTPVDFHAGNSQLYRLAKHVDFDRLSAVRGNMPAHLLNNVYVSLKPYRLLSKRYVDMLDIDDDAVLADFLRMEHWMYDSPDQAGAAFRQFARDLYQRNLLVEGLFELGGRRVDLSRLTMPIRNIYASADHLVPAESASALGRHCRSRDYAERRVQGGHLGLLIGRSVHHQTVPELADWLAAPL